MRAASVAVILRRLVAHQPQVEEIRRQRQQLERRPVLILQGRKVVPHPADAALFQQVDDARMPPLRAPEFEREAKIPRQPGNERSQVRLVPGRNEARGKLHQHAAEPGMQGRHAAQEVIHKFRAVPQVAFVRDLARNLARKGKRLRRLIQPVAEDVRFRHAIKGGVDLHRRKAARIKREPLRGRQVFGVERAAPVLIAPGARARADVPLAHVQTHPPQTRRLQPPPAICESANIMPTCPFPNVKKQFVIPAAILAAVLILSLILHGRKRDLVLTGIVTTDDVIVSSEMQGRLQELLVKEGDRVKRGDLLGRIRPEEMKADMEYYSNSEQQSEAQVTQAEADLKYQEEQTANQIQQAEANLSSAESLAAQSEADLENASLTFDRENSLFKRGAESKQAFDQARTANDSAKAHSDSLRKQMQAAASSLAMARSNARQNEARRAALQAGIHQLAAAGAQREKARVHLDYTEIRAPIDGVVDVRAALQGEVVNLGQGIVTLINEDDLWVRADIEETYIDGIRLGQKLKVRLPSGAEREGTVFYRGVDADFATQRDVSRTKRDIKTFEVRLRCDNKDRALAVGMTAYVLLPLR